MKEILGFVAVVAVVWLAVATVLMPLIVWDIHTHISRMRKTLEAIEKRMKL